MLAHGSLISEAQNFRGVSVLVQSLFCLVFKEFVFNYASSSLPISSACYIGSSPSYRVSETPMCIVWLASKPLTRHVPTGYVTTFRAVYPFLPALQRSNFFPVKAVSTLSGVDGSPWFV